MKTILDEGDEVKFKSYCLKHSKCKTGESGLSPARSKPPVESEKVGQRAQRLQELEEDFHSLIQLGELTQTLGLSERLADFIYQYWKLKRKANFNKALLPPKEEEENMVLQPQEESIHTRMRMFMHLRQDLERVGAFFNYSFTAFSADACYFFLLWSRTFPHFLSIYCVWVRVALVILYTEPDNLHARL